MKKTLITTMSFLLLLLSCVPLFAGEPRVVRIGAFDYYPAIFKDKDGTIKGFYVDALAAIAERENIRFKYIYGTWKEGMERLESGEVDLLTSVAFTPERAEFLDYGSQPLQTVWGELYTSPSSGIDGIQQVQGKKIAIMIGDFNGRYFIDLVKKFDITCEFVEMPDFNTIFQAIAAKQVDAGVVNSTFGAAKQHEYSLISTGVVFNPFDIFFAAAKGKNQELLTLLDNYLYNWRQQTNSPYAKARQKWSHGSVNAIQVAPPWLINSIAALGGIILITLTFIVLLKVQIKRATADIEQSKAVLRENEAKFRSYIDNSPDGIFVTDEDGRCLEVNPAAAAITGYETEELLNLSICDLVPAESFASSHHLLTLQELGIASNEFEFIHKNGKKRWCSVDTVKLSATRYLAFTKDITTRRRTEDQLLHAMATADAANTAKSRFLANMSHEIRTPMNGMIGLIELLLGTGLTKEQREYAELIKLSGRNLMQLLNDILDLSKIEAHKIELEAHDFNLQAEITGTINLLALHAKTKKLRLHAQIDPDVPILLRGDSGRLRQILNNIIGNAIKFTHEGSVLLHICTVAENEKEATLRFEVTDTGIGIAADKLDKIFEPFTQGDSSSTRQYGGTGLGLSIARQLTELMGGTIGVDSVQDGGTKFWFTVVLAKQLDKTAPVPEELAGDEAVASDLSNPDNGRKAPPTQNRNRILLAEDDQINQHMTKLFLTKSGYLVDVANNGREALKLLEENDYAMVLMDCMMPELSGYETTTMIRNPASAVRDHSIPVIALTANAMQEDRDNCLAAGMDDYLVKPIEVSKVLEILKKWVPFAAEADEGTDIGTTRNAIFDQEELIARSMGDIDLSRYVATIFMENAPDYIEAIRSALTAKDVGALRQSTHKLKGAAATMALLQLTEAARSFEELAVNGEIGNAWMSLPSLERKFEQACAALQQFILTRPEADPSAVSAAASD
ncbi:MAG: response regulator [Desulfuromonadales bacterium]|nr:response regulator [Desulfuromonadales bacterium]